MKLLTYAVASIVDANTHYLSAGQRLDTDFALRHGREIRSRSVVASLKALGRAIRSAVARLRSRHQEKRELAQLLRLNDALLRDIGLTRGDLLAVQYGATTLAALQSRREAASRERIGRGNVHRLSTTVRDDVIDEAASETGYATAKCA